MPSWLEPKSRELSAINLDLLVLTLNVLLQLLLGRETRPATLLLTHNYQEEAVISLN